uniref:Kinesin motor domain-containing protein n=1 Tax=Physcomitrium patens TaxID=3218 RepID=A0A2K1J4J9_PHYPA|nr:hypothetical protein PHYPA_022302 [Physcomitrium patens]
MTILSSLEVNIKTQFFFVYSIFTMHVYGIDLEFGVVLRKSLHLVELTRSEQVDRFGATNDRLKEVQYIIKSLSALGDVTITMVQKSGHMSSKNSKLLQLLKNSLGIGR